MLNSQSDLLNKIQLSEWDYITHTQGEQNDKWVRET